VQPLASGRQPPAQRPIRYSTRIIPFWVVGWIWQGLTILLLIGSFAVSVIGNVGMFVWPDMRALGSLDVWQGWTWADAGWALLYQIIIQACQAYTARVYGRRSKLYRSFLAASVVPAIWTYSLVVVPWAGSAHLWGAVWIVRLLCYAASAILLPIVLTFNDVLQEYLLIRDA